MNIAPWPLVARSALVRAFRPGSAPFSEAPFRTLRKQGWVTEGVCVVPHSAKGAQGRLTFFSALNVEAARQARLGARTAATRLAKDARQMESRPEFTLLTKLLSGAPASVVQAVLAGRVPANAAPEIHVLVREIAKATEERREARGHQWDLVDIASGTVVEVKADHVTLVDASGAHTMLPRWYSAIAHRDQVGAVLAILTDKLGEEQALVQPVPGVELDYARALSGFKLTPADLRLSEADATYLSGEPAPLRVLVPIKLPA